MALHPPYNRVKAIGAITSHQLWTNGVVALPHTSHTRWVLCEDRIGTGPPQNNPRRSIASVEIVYMAAVLV